MGNAQPAKNWVPCSCGNGTVMKDFWITVDGKKVNSPQPVTHSVCGGRGQVYR